MNRTLTLSTLAAAALLSACATTNTPPPGLVGARDAVKMAQSDPRVLQNAPLELTLWFDRVHRLGVFQSVLVFVLLVALAGGMAGGMVLATRRNVAAGSTPEV